MTIFANLLSTTPASKMDADMGSFQRAISAACTSTLTRKEGPTVPQELIDAAWAYTDGHMAQGNTSRGAVVARIGLSLSWTLRVRFNAALPEVSGGLRFSEVGKLLDGGTTLEIKGSGLLTPGMRVALAALAALGTRPTHVGVALTTSELGYAGLRTSSVYADASRGVLSGLGYKLGGNAASEAARILYQARNRDGHTQAVCEQLTLEGPCTSVADVHGVLRVAVALGGRGGFAMDASVNALEWRDGAYMARCLRIASNERIVLGDTMIRSWLAQRCAQAGVTYTRATL